MKKLFVLALLSMGFAISSFAQQEDSNAAYKPTAFILDLLAKNDSLKLIYDQTKHQLTNEQLSNIFAKTENKEYNTKQTQAALQLTAALGDSWVFTDTVSPENRLNFKSIEEFLKFRDGFPISSKASFNDDYTLKRQETTFRNGVKEIIEKDANGNYIKTTITAQGVKTVEKIKDISSYNTATVSVQRNNN
ncbi:hypothetical protein [Flagellimonas sediminis]|uniref:Outer membrane lipoprotein carrier protein LolA n=1 Tax=Flagellimonas sediminis TaxID=2696468 RepID=A0A6I5KUY9_9FLAO|nr:hypothetical protein [Allomuricauda sediminis]NDV41848.1 hypothetical protein [Allomuricauda sediminis]